MNQQSFALVPTLEQTPCAMGTLLMAYMRFTQVPLIPYSLRSLLFSFCDDLYDNNSAVLNDKHNHR
jgi:hypothetical protein